MIESAEEFVLLRTSEKREEYERASRDSASVAIWVDVIDRFPDMREWVAHNKTVPKQVLELLAQDPDPLVRAVVARRRSLTEDIFLTLARDTQESVRSKLALNPKLPESARNVLINDRSDWVREKVFEGDVNRRPNKP